MERSRLDRHRDRYVGREFLYMERFGWVHLSKGLTFTMQPPVYLFVMYSDIYGRVWVGPPSKRTHVSDDNSVLYFVYIVQYCDSGRVDGTFECELINLPFLPPTGHIA